MMIAIMIVMVEMWMVAQKASAQPTPALHCALWQMMLMTIVTVTRMVMLMTMALLMTFMNMAIGMMMAVVTATAKTIDARMREIAGLAYCELQEFQLLQLFSFSNF